MRPRSAVLELILLIAVVVAAVLGTITWLSMRWQRAWLLEEARSGLSLASDTLHSSLRFWMMENQREEILATIKRVTRDTRIKTIRLIEHRGRVTISTRGEDRDRRVDRNDASCTLCHAGDPGAVSPSILAYETQTLLTGNVMRALTPVVAEQGCINGACHQQEVRSRVLGVIDVSLSLDDVEQNLVLRQIKLAGLSLGALLGGCGLLWLVLTRRLRRPMHDLIRGIRRVAAGELSHRIPVRTRDEFGELAESFNAMSLQLSTVQTGLIQSERLISMGKLAAGVAHEINNPITGILSYAEDLLEDADPLDRCRKDYEVIVREALRCRQIVRNLLDFARQGTPALARVRPGELIQKALDVLIRLAAFRNIRFERQIEEDLPAIEADPVQIQQVLINLMVNAQQAMPKGGTIVLGARRTAAGDRVEFSVKDEGAGIPPAIRSRIFEPFFSTKEGKTDGLGLAVCLGIVQQHSGSIDFESELGKGTTFRIGIPVSRPGGGRSHEGRVEHGQTHPGGR